jgi:large subunit ribosomal protein L3
MMGLIGRKIGMTQLFDEKGDIVPVTVIEAGPCTVTEIRTGERDGYTALQLGFGTNKERRFTKPVLGQFTKRNLPPSRHLREFRIKDVATFTLGQTLNASVFEKGEHVDVEGTTKGRGFAGIIKRHGFTGGSASHGPTMGREPGSIGSSAYPSRVIKGKRLPGRMGGKSLTTKNLVVAGVDAEQNVLLVRGAIPGPTNGLVFVFKRS